MRRLFLISVQLAVNVGVFQSQRSAQIMVIPGSGGVCRAAQGVFCGMRVMTWVVQMRYSDDDDDDAPFLSC